MDNIIGRDALNFITNLTEAGTSELQEYAAEIYTDRKFHDSIEKKRGTKGGKRESYWEYGIGPILGTVLYIICRKNKPESAVETGVGSGVSSSYILCAMEKNGRGNLYSIDLPLQHLSQSGWLIPEYLRHRWHLTGGRSADTLEPLLKKVKEIDIFLHDSDHSYENMMREFEAAWKHLKNGGLLLSHNIDYSDAFSDFCRKYRVKGYTLGDMGGIIKL